MPLLEELDYLRVGRPRSLSSDEPSAQYEPVDAVATTVRTTAIMGAAGAVMSSVQNSLARQNIGAMGIFTRTGGTIATFGREPNLGHSPPLFLGIVSLIPQQLPLEQATPLLPAPPQTSGRRTTAGTTPLAASLEARC